MEIKFLHQFFFSLVTMHNFNRSLLLFVFCVIPFLGLSQSTVVVTAIDNMATEATPATTDRGIFEIDLGSINNTGTTITVNFVLGGTATVGVDYANPGNSVVIPDGQRRVQLTITVVDDISFEGNEEIIMRLTGADNTDFMVAGNSSSSASIVVVDNDGCSTGPDSPLLSNSIVTRFCSDVEVDLSSFVTSPTPPRTTIEWSTNPNPNPNNPNSFLPSSIINTGGDYYGFYFGSFNGVPCISPVVSLPTIIFDAKPSLGVTNNNNQVCIEASQGSSRRDLDNTIVGETPGGFWNIIDGPAGNTVFINFLNVVDFNGQPAGAYTFSYTPNYAAAPSCPVESIEVIIYASDCDTNCDAGNRPPELNPGLETNICVDAGASSLDLSDYTSSTPPAGTRLVWSRVSDFTRQDAYLTNTVIQTTGTFFAFFLDETNNCASPNLAVSIIFIEKPEIFSFTENALCTEGIMTLSATATSGSIINWYASPTSTVPLEENSSNFTTPNLTTTTTYYVEAVLNGCVSDRQAVIASINDEPVVQSTGVTIEACDIVGADFPSEINLFTGLTQDVSGTWALSSGPQASLAISDNGLVDFEGAPPGLYTFIFTTNTAVAPCSETSVVISVRVNECIIDTDNDTISDEDEIAIGTDPENNDSDNDGILDAVEVGDDLANPLDTDNDGIIDALDSNVLDTDMDGVVDQLDPANTNPCIPDNTVGMCDTDGDGIPDGIEIENNTDPLDPCDPNLTPDCAPDPIDLQISKTVDVLRPAIGDEITFTVSLTNLSADRVIRIVINDLITADRGFEYVSHNATKGTYNVNTGLWEIEEILGNEVNTIEITVRVLETGDYTNTAALGSSFPIDNNATNNTSVVVVDAINTSDLEIVKEVDVLAPFIGDEVTFTITVTNLREDIVFSAFIDELISQENGFEYVSHTASKGLYDEVTGIWEIQDIQGNEINTLEITVIILDNGDYINTAELASAFPVDEDETNNSASITVNVVKRSNDDCGFLFNQFSPNGDGVNDFLIINCIENFPNNTIEIFDRYGNQVYKAAPYDNSWDGTGRNGAVPKGTYYYVLDLGTRVNILGGIEEIPIEKGWIQIIR